MSGLTSKMREVLQKADLKRGEINAVPMSTMYGLEARKLISSAWRRPGAAGGGNQTTAGGSFPWYNGVKLSAAGINAARSVQGLEAIASESKDVESASGPTGTWISPRS